MTATVGTIGLHDGINEVDYHADRGSLSVSGAKLLLGKSPAHFKWQRDNGQPHKAAFDFGHAAHALVLGVGAPLAVVDAEDWRTKAAQQQRKEAYEQGHTPLLRAEHETVVAMAAAIKAHPLASALFDPAHGKAEQSGYFADEPTGVTRRFRLDWLPNTDGGRLIVPDFKTTIDASPKAISKSLTDFGYASQARWYLDGINALGIAEHAAFLLVFIEKTPPHVVTVAEPDAEALAWGAERNRRALDLYARCVETGEWPGYSDDVELVSLPRWA